MLTEISVNQSPDGGGDYPFKTRTELSDFILHVYLCFEYQPYTGDLYLVLEDTDSDFVVTVKDSSDFVLFTGIETTAEISDWGTDRKVFSWQTETAIFSFTIVYNERFDGEGILDPRTYNCLPKRINKVILNGIEYQDDVVIAGGFNTEVKRSFKTDVLNKTLITVTAQGGLGDGTYDDCNETQSFVATINNIRPDENFNFRIITDDCMRLQTPMVVLNGGTGTAEYSYLGKEKNEVKSIIQIFDDCKPCCECSDFVRTYKGIKNVWSDWKTLAESLVNTRDQFLRNKLRWEEVKDKVEQNPIRLVLKQQKDCYIFAGFVFANTHRCCLNNVVLRFTFQYFSDDNIEVNPFPIDSVEGWLETSTGVSEQDYVPDIYNESNKWPVFNFYLDTLPSQETFTAKLRLNLSCDSDAKVLLTGTVHWDSSEPSVCPETTVTVPTNIQTIWTTHSVPDLETRILVQEAIPLE